MKDRLKRSLLPAAAALRVVGGVLLDGAYRSALRDVAASVAAFPGLDDELFVREPPVFVLMVGFSGSGKSRLVSDSPSLSRMYCIRTDAIHDALRERFPEFRNDDVASYAYWKLQAMTRLVRRSMLRMAVQGRLCIVVDACNLRAAQRRSQIAWARRHGYATFIVEVMVPEDVLLGRLEARDEAYVREGRGPAYVDLYRKVQVPIYEPPMSGEADWLRLYNGTGEFGSTFVI